MSKVLRVTDAPHLLFNPSKEFPWGDVNPRAVKVIDVDGDGKPDIQIPDLTRRLTLRLSDDELALFDLLFKDSISKANRERLKQASRAVLSSLQELLRPIQDWTQKTVT